MTANTLAAQRLKTLIAQDTGLTFAIVGAGQKPDAAELQFMLCTTASRSEVKSDLPAAALNQTGGGGFFKNSV